VREVFTLVELLKEAGRAKLPEAAPHRLERSIIDVECIGREPREIGEERPERRVWALDASVRVMKLSNIDVYISSGALVGEKMRATPGDVRYKWIGVRPRFNVDEEWKELLGKFSDRLYVKSKFNEFYFDGKYDEETVMDELRIGLENKLIEEWEGSGVLLVDGPLFPTPRILTRPDLTAFGADPYSRVYSGLIEERLKSARRGEVVGIVKRLEHSHFLGKCFEKYAGLDDAALSLKLTEGFRGPVFIGPLKLGLRTGDKKYVGYLVKPIGHRRAVVRVETLDEDVEGRAKWISSLISHEGIPIPISVADRISKRLSAGAYYLLYGLSPLEPTYESLEKLAHVERELGS